MRFWFSKVVCLAPKPLILHRPVYAIRVFFPVEDFRPVRHGQRLDNVHVVAGNQLAVAVMRLSTSWQFFGFVQIVYAQEHVSSVPGADLEDSTECEMCVVCRIEFVFGCLDKDDLTNFKLCFADWGALGVVWRGEKGTLTRELAVSLSALPFQGRLDLIVCVA